MAPSGLRAANPPRSRSVWLANLMFAGALALLAAYAIAFAVHAVLTVPYPFPLDYGEGAVLNAAWRVARGLPIYLPYDASPSIGANYPPVFFVLQAALIKLFGASLTWGRLISLAAAMAVAVAIWHAGPDCDRRARWIGALTWLALGPVYAWSAIDKGDMLAIALGIWGILLAARGRSIAAGVLLGLAVMTKQTALTALGVAVVFPLLPFGPPSRHQVLRTAVAGLIVIGAISFVAQFALGPAYLDHVLLANVQAISVRQAVVALLILARDHWPLLLLAAISTALALRRRKLTIWHGYWLAAMAALVATSGKIGAYTNYFLEVLALSALLLPWLFAQIERDRAVLASATAVLAQSVLLLHVPFVREYVPTPDAALLNSHRTVAARVASIPGPLLAENAAWNVLLRTEADIDDAFLFTQLAQAGRWDPSTLQTALEQRRFGRILLEFDPADPAADPYHRDRFPPGALEALQQHYTGDRVEDYWVFVPR